MNLRHIVLFSFKSSTTVTDAFLCSKFEELIKIPMTSNYAFGRTQTARGLGFTHALSIDVAGLDELSLYSNHPIHMELLQDVIKPNLRDGTGSVLAMDIQVSPSE